MSSKTVLTEEEKQVKKSIDQAKNAINSFLKELGISKILYVDDKCSINELKESFIGTLLKLKASNPKGTPFGSWSGAIAPFRARITKLWDDTDENGKRQLYIKLLEFENNVEDIANSIAPLKLKEHLGNKIDLFSPTEWVNQKDAILQALTNDSKALCLFDIDFGNAPPPDGRDGRDFAVELLSTPGISDLVHCGIFSHLFDVSEEYERRNEYSETHNLDKDKFYTISKRRFTTDKFLPALAEGIRNTLLISEIELLKTESSKIIKSSARKSLEEINNLKPDSFNHIVQKSSKKEGSWEMTTLLRVNSIINTEKSLQTLLSKSTRKKINNSINQIRKVEKIQTGGDTPYDKTEVIGLRKKELFLDQEILNKLHYPLSNGDIFKIEDKDYILLGQPCNLALRGSGKREIRGKLFFDTGFLLELETVSFEYINTLSKNQLLNIGFIEQSANKPDNYVIVRFPLFKTVSLIPLDLCVYNDNGRAVIDLNIEKNESEILQESWKKRYSELYKNFITYRDNIKLYRKLKSSNKNQLKDAIYYGKLFNGYVLNNDTCLNYNSSKITLNIQRVMNYKAPYSSDLLQQFMAYLARNAFDHNIVNG